MQTTFQPTSAPTEILTIDDVASLLKLPRSSIYEMTRKRGQVRHANPIPITRICGHIRFRRSDIDAWIAKCAQHRRVQ